MSAVVEAIDRAVVNYHLAGSRTKTHCGLAMETRNAFAPASRQHHAPFKTEDGRIAYLMPGAGRGVLCAACREKHEAIENRVLR